VAVDWQEPVVLQRKCGHPLSTLTDIGPAVAASKHTTAPVNHTRPSLRKHSPDVTTPSEMAEPDYCLLLIYRPRKDERLSWPGWLTCSGWFTNICGHPSAAARAKDRESSLAKDWRSTTVLRWCGGIDLGAGDIVHRLNNPIIFHRHITNFPNFVI